MFDQDALRTGLASIVDKSANQLRAEMAVAAGQQRAELRAEFSIVRAELAVIKRNTIIIMGRPATRAEETGFGIFSGGVVCKGLKCQKDLCTTLLYAQFCAH